MVRDLNSLILEQSKVKKKVNLFTEKIKISVWYFNENEERQEFENMSYMDGVELHQMKYKTWTRESMIYSKWKIE